MLSIEQIGAIGNIMFCLNDDKNTLGFVRVETDKVIAACNKKINSIYTYRSNSRRQYCQQWLDDATKRWQYFWRFLGCKKPLLRDALEAFYGGQYPFSFEVSITYGSQEQSCKDLLRVAKATNNSIMWISNKGAKACDL